MLQPDIRAHGPTSRWNIYIQGHVQKMLNMHVSSLVKNVFSDINLSGRESVSLTFTHMSLGRDPVHLVHLCILRAYHRPIT